MQDGQVWTTRGVETAKRLAFWNETLRESIFELHFEAQREAFDAELTQYNVGALSLSQIAVSTGHSVERCPGAIARSSVPRFNLNYVRHGQFSVEQNQRVSDLKPGDFVLLDGRQRYSVTSSEETLHVSLHLPVDWLERWLPAPEDCVGEPIKRGMPWASALEASLRDAHLFASAPQGMSRLCSEQLGGAIALAFGAARNGRLVHHRTLYERFIQVLEDVSSDPEVEAKDVAERLSISPRYLYKILSKENTTYCREMIRIKLGNSVRMLRDRRFDGLAVSEIAWRSGFRDPSHFSKRFRQHFGCSPGAFRSRDVE